VATGIAAMPRSAVWVAAATIGVLQLVVVPTPPAWASAVAVPTWIAAIGRTAFQFAASRTD